MRLEMDRWARCHSQVSAIPELAVVRIGTATAKAMQADRDQCIAHGASDSSPNQLTSTSGRLGGSDVHMRKEPESGGRVAADAVAPPPLQTSVIGRCLADAIG